MCEKEKMDFLIQKGYVANENGQIVSPNGRIISKTNKYDKKRYRMIQDQVNKKRFRVRGHRFIFYYFNRSLPLIVDHINGDTLDNSIKNLRAADHCINNQNRRGVKGYFKTRANTFAVVIWFNKVKKYCGTFSDEKTASEVYHYWKSILHV
jgi:hypothetical protein